MQTEEYDALERVEREHWFYQGKRQLVRRWMERVASPMPGGRIVDCGAGTGELVRELHSIYEPLGMEVVGIEHSEEARRLAQERKGVPLLAGSILDLPLKDNVTRATIALDVLEHIEEDQRAFQELLRITAPGGIILINVPAFMGLWSEWDVSLGHFRRYTKQRFRELMLPHRGEFEVLYFEYVNVFAFLPILVARKLARVFPLRSRMEDYVPSRRINALLFNLFVKPGQAAWFHPPFGSSLFCVLKKR